MIVALWKENNVINLSALPPCSNVLRIHSEKANFVAKVWRSSLKNKIDEESFVNLGWDEYGNIWWIDQAFPDDTSRIFFENLYDDKKYDFGNKNQESEDKKEDWKKKNSCLVTLDLLLNTLSNKFGPS